MFLFFALSAFALVAADVCPSGSVYSSYRGGTCFEARSTPETWNDALSWCQYIGGALPVPRNAFENNQLSSIVQSSDTLGTFGSTWVGAVSDSNANWMDYNASGLVYSNFVSGQAGKPNSCASMTYAGNWYASNCYNTATYLCQLSQLPTNYTAPGVTTPRPVLPTYVPSMCPGYDHDTNGSPCPSGWSFYLPTCACYYLSPYTYTWFEAEQHCISNSGHLTSIHSQDEAVFVLSLTDDSTKMIQIGLQYIGNQWLWSDGSALNFLNWAPRGVNPDYSTNACGVLLSRGYYFDSFLQNGKCTTKYSHSVCKRYLLH